MGIIEDCCRLRMVARRIFFAADANPEARAPTSGVYLFVYLGWMLFVSSKQLYNYGTD